MYIKTLFVVSWFSPSLSLFLAHALFILLPHTFRSDIAVTVAAVRYFSEHTDAWRWNAHTMQIVHVLCVDMNQNGKYRGMCIGFSNPINVALALFFVCIDSELKAAQQAFSRSLWRE